MAHMVPHEMEADNNSFGEKQVFNALKSLSDEYTVFHSVRWNEVLRSENNWNPKRENRTVVWGECDFTILHPTKGILVIEVKSGGIECIDNTWTYIRSDNGERHPMKNPLAQADRTKYRFKDIIGELFDDTSGTANAQYCLVESAVWFPSISRRDVVGELPQEFLPEIVLYENALDNPQKFIESIYDFYDGYRHTKLSPEAYEKVYDAFAPCYRVLPSLRSKRLEQEAEFVRLTREQSSLLDYLEEQRVAAIQGAAGTGKTMLAIEKAKRLAESGKVLFLCYNQFLRVYLQNLKNESPKEYENIDFYNLPQLACAKIGVPSVEKEDIYQFLDSFDSYDWDYQHIIIDEGQDFDEEEINKLYDTALLLEGAFYIFYDKNQFVQGREFPQWLRNAECRLVLNINCRNTYSIAETSGKPINVVPRVKDRSVKGDMPRFYINKDRTAFIKQLSRLIDQYRNNGYLYNQICVLTVKTESASMLNGVERIGNHTISSVRNNKGVLFTTARKFKGLESDVIIIIDVDENTFADSENRRLFYVGSSRAKHFLDIVYVGEDESLKRLVSAMSDERYPTPVIGLARSLDVKPVKG